MLRLYYIVWVDCIKRGISQDANKKNWKIASIIFMTMAMAFNFVLFITILERYFLKFYFYKIDISFLPVYVNNVISYLILFILPCLLINYLLIFRKNRYETLLKVYPYFNGKLFVSYFVFSMMLPIILLWLAIFFN